MGGGGADAKADNIKRLIGEINFVEGKTSDQALTAVASVVYDGRLKWEAARLAAEKAFSGEPLEGVGGEVWRALWDSARRYSTEIAYPGQPFPPSREDARCVLCQQPLEGQARERMARFEEFIQKDTERQAQEAEKASRTALQGLGSTNIGTRSLKANLQEVALQNPDLARRTRRFLAAARLRRYALVKALDAAQKIHLPDIAPNPVVDLTRLETNIRNYAVELQKSASADERSGWIRSSSVSRKPPKFFANSLPGSSPAAFCRRAWKPFRWRKGLGFIETSPSPKSKADPS